MPAVVRAGDMLDELGALEPFQQEATRPPATAILALTSATARPRTAPDGRMGLQLLQKDTLGQQDGHPVTTISALIPFPRSRAARARRPTALGGLSSFVFSKRFRRQAVKFIEWFNSRARAVKFADAN